MSNSTPGRMTLQFRELADRHDATLELMSSAGGYVAIFTDGPLTVLRDYTDEGARELNAPTDAILYDWNRVGARFERMS